MAGGWTVVLDVGKTHSKASLWDESAQCIAHRSRPNQRLAQGASLTLDVSGIEKWLIGVLKEFAALGPVRAIIPVAHGAGLAIVRRGRLQFAPLDYEWAGVAVDRATYDKQRDVFALTGSPRLPAGLNMGIQLHWLESIKSADFRSGHILPWAQYWAWLLSGVLASEVTSLGCHSDLWRPHTSTPSDLAIKRGWAERFAPLTPAGEVLGTLEPEWVNQTGLSPKVEIFCGLHDTNAALVDARSHGELIGKDMTVLSTGTWFVAMRTPVTTEQAFIESLPEHRDCLVNVSAWNSPVPSSRFMGGREIEILSGTSAMPDTPDLQHAYENAAIRAIEEGVIIPPTGVKGVGPYPNSVRSPSFVQGNYSLAQSHLYAALLADVSLDLIGSREILLVEGRFSAASVFVRALASLRPQSTVLVSGDENGVARGALRIAGAAPASYKSPTRVSPLPLDVDDYRVRWREIAENAA